MDDYNSSEKYIPPAKRTRFNEAPLSDADCAPLNLPSISTPSAQSSMEERIPKTNTNKNKTHLSILKKLKSATTTTRRIRRPNKKGRKPRKQNKTTTTTSSHSSSDLQDDTTTATNNDTPISFPYNSKNQQFFPPAWAAQFSNNPTFVSYQNLLAAHQQGSTAARSPSEVTPPTPIPTLPTPAALAEMEKDSENDTVMKAITPRRSRRVMLKKEKEKRLREKEVVNIVSEDENDNSSEYNIGSEEDCGDMGMDEDGDTSVAGGADCIGGGGCDSRDPFDGIRIDIEDTLELDGYPKITDWDQCVRPFRLEELKSHMAQKQERSKYVRRSLLTAQQANERRKMQNRQSAERTRKRKNWYIGLLQQHYGFLYERYKKLENQLAVVAKHSQGSQLTEDDLKFQKMPDRPHIIAFNADECKKPRGPKRRGPPPKNRSESSKSIVKRKLKTSRVGKSPPKAETSKASCKTTKASTRSHTSANSKKEKSVKKGVLPKKEVKKKQTSQSSAVKKSSPPTPTYESTPSVSVPQNVMMVPYTSVSDSTQVAASMMYQYQLMQQMQSAMSAAYAQGCWAAGYQAAAGMMSMAQQMTPEGVETKDESLGSDVSSNTAFTPGDVQFPPVITPRGVDALGDFGDAQSNPLSNLNLDDVGSVSSAVDPSFGESLTESFNMDVFHDEFDF